jgi:S-adenosylmethionine synthetase
LDKIPTKFDRSIASAARYLAEIVVVVAQAERCAFKLSYEIYFASPLLISADTSMATRVGGA